MFHLDAQLQQNIADIMEQVQAVSFYIAEHENLTGDDLSRITYACTEIALLAFSVSDLMGNAEEIGDRLLQREVSSCLRQLALHCVDVQVWSEEPSLRYHVKQMRTHCNSVAKMLGMPELEEAEKAQHIGMPVPENALVIGEVPEEAAPEQDSREPHNSLTVLPLTEDQIELLKIEIKALREILSAIVLERDNLLLVESKKLEARYMRELGSLEAEVYREESNARYLQRKYEMMQAAVNRREEIRVEAIEAKLEEAFKAYQKVYEEFVQKAREATEAARKRKARVEEDAKARAGEDAKAQGEQAQSSQDGLVQSTAREENKSEQDAARNKTEKDSSQATGDVGTNHEESKKEDPNQRLKKLYRKIVKAMHPDLHPDQDEHTKELFKKAIVAYEKGDLQTLEEIALTLEGETEDGGEDLLERLLQEKERLLSLIRGIREQIHLIRNQYPFTKRAILDDPVRLKEEQEKLKLRLERARQRARAYQERIDEVLKQNGRADHKAE